MKKFVIILVAVIIFIIVMITSLVVYAQDNVRDTPKLEEKVSQEIKYLDNYITSLLGHFNGLTIGEDVFQTTPNESQIEKQSTQVGTASKQESSQGGVEEGSDSLSNGTKNSNKESGGEEKTTTSGGNGSQGNQSSQNNAQNSILLKEGKYTIDWKAIQSQIEQLYQTWNTISIDLHALNIDGNSILAFSDGLNNATKHIKNKDKAKSMEELENLHQLLFKYKESYNEKSNEGELLYIEIQAVGAYVDITNDNWQKASDKLSQAEIRFSSLLNTVTQEIQNQTTLNQCYILINELRNAVNLKDKEIFYIQYQNFINKIEMLM